MLFHMLEDCFVIVRKSGVFRQAEVFARGEQLYAGVGTGFVRLCAHGTSTVPTMLWEDLSEHPDIALVRGAPVYIAPPERPVQIAPPKRRIAA